MATKSLKLDYDDMILLGAAKHVEFLENVMSSFDVPEEYYSIGSRKDMSVCILLKNQKWSVFSFERGSENNESSYEDIYDACCQIIHLLSSDKVEEENMIQQYNNLLDQNSRKSVTQKAIEKIINEFSATVAIL